MVHKSDWQLASDAFCDYLLIHGESNLVMFLSFASFTWMFMCAIRLITVLIGRSGIGLKRKCHLLLVFMEGRRWTVFLSIGILLWLWQCTVDLWRLKPRFRVLHWFWLAPLFLWLYSHKELPLVAVLAAWSLTYCFVISGRLVENSYPSMVIHVSCISMCWTLVHVV